MGTQGLIQGNVMSARVMNALGASNLERTICATAGYTGTAMAHGVSPEVDPEEWPNARYLLVWGWNPLSTAPHLWRKLLDARKQGARLVVVDPFRSRTARVADEHLRPLPGTDAALAIGMMRAIVDAGLQDEDWCRAHADGYDELLAELDGTSVEDCAAQSAGWTAEAIARVGRDFASIRPALLRLGVGAQRHAGAPAAYCDDRVAARADGRVEGPRRRLLVHPARHRRGDQLESARARGPAARPGAHDQHVAARPGAHRPGAGPAGEGARRAGTRTPRRSRPTRSGCSRACGATTSSRSCWSSS